VYKMKHPERFNEWWRPLTKQGDPSHRHNLVGEAFDAGYEAGKRAALMTLGRKLVEEYATQETIPECHASIKHDGSYGPVTCGVCKMPIPASKETEAARECDACVAMNTHI
jgi:hypothetical protein